MRNTKLDAIQTENLDNVTGGFLGGLIKSLVGGGIGESKGSESLFAPGGGEQSARGNGILGKLFGNAGEG
jgi:hypothetical protein